MGGCFTKKASSDPSDPPEHEEPPEETVKEVLSETPAKPKEDETAAVERSEAASEIGSLSGILSASSAATEKRGAPDTGERSPAKSRGNRSVSGELVAVKRDRGVGIGCRSGGGISSPAPARRREGSIGRTNSSREATARTRSAENAGNRRRVDPGERSGRRSVSPAVKRPPDLQQRPWGGGGGGVKPRSLSAPRVNGAAAPGGGGSSEGKESLENPLVTLECFIFL